MLLSPCKRAIRVTPYSLISYFLLLSSLTSCFVNEDFSGGICQTEDAIRIQFSIPDLQSVLTRVSDADVNRVDVFVFSTSDESIDDGTSFIMHSSFDGSNITDNTVSISLGSGYRESDVWIYLVANVDAESLASIKTIKALKEFILAGQLSEDIGLPMIGVTQVNTKETSASIALERSVAKVSALCTETTQASLEGVELYNNSIKGYLGSPMISDLAQLFVDELILTNSTADNFPSASHVYTYPSKGVSADGKSDGAFAVVKVNRKNSAGVETDQYYRVNFREENEAYKTDKTANKLTYLNLLPNHHYQIVVTGFLSDGFNDPQEAAKHPESDQFIEYIIHDHALEVLSMVTDGYNELGVSPIVHLTRQMDGENTLRRGTLTIKCYAPDKTVSFDEIQIEYDNEWFSIDKGPHIPVDINYGDGESENIKDDPNPDYDKDEQKGQQFDFVITIKDEKRLYEDMSWDMVVTWNGLKRNVKVSYEAAFLLPEVCSVTLTILNDNEEEDDVISDYWAFITGAGDTEVTKKAGSGVSKLWGILPEDMMGNKKRTGGFHFPMPYGNQKKWKYRYTVDFTKILNMENHDGSISNVEISGITGEEGFFNTNNLKLTQVTGKDNTYTLDFTGTGIDETAYKYAGGVVTFLVTYNDGKTSEITASLYHTGFFHYMDDTNYVPSEYKGYYYYEVVPMGDGYWLDRNIGARSNKSFIDITNSPTEGNVDRSAAGLHYTIIKKTNDFALPDWDFRMVPPGYHVPNQTEWDALRLSRDFITSSVVYNNTTYMTTYYNCGGKIGNIYLNKSRFYIENNVFEKSVKFSEVYNNGDAGAGYYWSVTEAPAMEKEQMGNWLRALYLNGSASSYTNASVADHRMPVRCKAGLDATKAEEHYVSLNVHNATHVLLFDIETRTPINTFPGKAVGTTDSSIKWQHFSYATTEDLSKLYMLFVKLELNGKVTIHRRNKDSFVSTTNYSKDFLSEEYAWRVENGAYYDFCEEGLNRPSNVLTGITEAPDDCDTGSENSGGNNGDSGTEQQHPDADLNDYTFTKQGDEEIVIESNKHYFKNYDSNCQHLAHGNYNWASLPVGSKIRIYVSLVKDMNDDDDQFSLQLFNGSWSMIQDINQNMVKGNAHNVNGTKQYIYELEYTEALYNNLVNNNGLIMQGRHCVLLGVTVIKKAVELVKGSYTWTDEVSINWPQKGQGFINLTSDLYDWSSVTSGSTLTIEFRQGDGPQIQVRLNNTGGSIPGIDDYTPVGWGGKLQPGQTKIVYTLTESILTTIRNGGGIYFAGGNYTLTKVDIHVN